MKLALIGRSDDRGLGIQTVEIARHLHPDRVAHVSMDHLSPYPDHPGRFDNVVAQWRPMPDGSFRFAEAEMRAFLDGADVMLTCETPYDYRLYEVAREMGVATVCQVNAEFYRHATDPNLPRPDVVLAPSRWRMEHMPGAVYLPLPVDRERCAYRQRTEARTFLHVAGHRTNMDRNGTRIVMEAAGYVTEPVRIIIRSQSPLGWDPWQGMPVHAKVDIYSSDCPVPDYWSLYDEADVLLLPRRFGGQSLQLHEAMSCGVVPLMTNCPPQNEVLPYECLIRQQGAAGVPMQSGIVNVHNADPRHLAQMIDGMARDPEAVTKLSAWADEWAAAHSWEALLPKWTAMLERAAERGPTR